jgi:maleate isomerase
MTKPFEVRSDDGLGWRAKIGVIVPATNTIAQPEYEALRPAWVTNHVTRMAPANRGTTLEDYRRSLMRGTDHVKAAMDLVIPSEPDMLLLGHSIDTFKDSVADAEAMREDLVAHAGGIPMTLPSLAFLAALKALKVRPRIAALTPYQEPGDEKVLKFFTAAGFEVVKLIGLKCKAPLEIASRPEPVIVEALKTLAQEDVDVIIEPGTNMPTGHIAAEAEKWLGKPVLACNTVTYWHALRSLGIEDRARGFGTLLENY